VPQARRGNLMIITKTGKAAFPKYRAYEKCFPSQAWQGQTKIPVHADRDL
jgi:hypothetical protein